MNLTNRRVGVDRCHVCHEDSALYDPMPHCRICGQLTCEDCAMIGSYIEPDGAPDAKADQHTVECLKCGVDQ